MSEWINAETNPPTESGHYFVEIRGDSECCDGYTLWEFPPYVMLMEIKIDGDDIFSPSSDEDWSFVDAWWSTPVIVPQREVSNE